MSDCLGSRRRENTVLRANLPPKSVYVIPNAIVADHFCPARSGPPTDMSQYSRLGLGVDSSSTR